MNRKEENFMATVKATDTTLDQIIRNTKSFWLIFGLRGADPAA